MDAGYRVFHVKREQGRPVVVRTPVDPALRTRHIQISENDRREHYGLLLAEDGGLYVLTCDHYRLEHLPLDRYDPERMDFKLIFNPLYITAIWSDERVVRAVAMDTLSATGALCPSHVAGPGHAHASGLRRAFSLHPAAGRWRGRLAAPVHPAGRTGLADRPAVQPGGIPCLARTLEKGTPQTGPGRHGRGNRIYGLIAAALLGSDD